MSGEVGSIKRRHIGFAGAAIVLAEALSNFKSSEKVSNEILKFKEDFQASKVEREQYFVRKEELNKLSQKMDKVNDQLVELHTQVASLRSYLKNEGGYVLEDTLYDESVEPAIYIQTSSLEK